PRRVRVAERADGDAADEVEELVAVDVGDLGALGVIEHDAGHQRVALRAGGEVLVLLRTQRLALGPRHRGDETAVLIRRLRHRAVFYINARAIRTTRSTAARLPNRATAPRAIRHVVTYGKPRATSAGPTSGVSPMP